MFGCRVIKLLTAYRRTWKSVHKSMRKQKKRTHEELERDRDRDRNGIRTKSLSHQRMNRINIQAKITIHCSGVIFNSHFNSIPFVRCLFLFLLHFLLFHVNVYTEFICQTPLSVNKEVNSFRFATQSLN